MNWSELRKRKALGLVKGRVCKLYRDVVSSRRTREATNLLWNGSCSTASFQSPCCSHLLPWCTNDYPPLSILLSSFSNSFILLFQVLALRRPFLHKLLDYEDEFFALLTLLLETHSLRNTGLSLHLFFHLPSNHFSCSFFSAFVLVQMLLFLNLYMVCDGDHLMSNSWILIQKHLTTSTTQLWTSVKNFFLLHFWYAFLLLPGPTSVIIIFCCNFLKLHVFLSCNVSLMISINVCIMIRLCKLFIHVLKSSLDGRLSA